MFIMLGAGYFFLKDLKQAYPEIAHPEKTLTVLGTLDATEQSNSEGNVTTITQRPFQDAV